MNRTILIALLCFLLCQLTANAQEQQQQLELAFHKTTSLVFPYPIQSVDRGSGESWPKHRHRQAMCSR